MLFRTIASAFFLEPSNRDDLATLAARAGLIDVSGFDDITRGSLGFRESDRGVLGGRWGAFQSTWVIVDEVDGLRCLQLYSSYTRYLDAVGASRDGGGRDDDPLFGYVQTFRDACLSLSPRVAFLDTQAHDEDDDWENRQGSRAFVLAQAPLVAAFDADALARRFFSLLYLNSEMSARWTPDPPWYDREMVILPEGRLIFAGSGATRMA
jgi:hypothetical protein